MGKTTCCEKGLPRNAEELANRLKAMGHPARLMILSLLAQRDQCCCGQVVSDLPLAQSTVSQHLKVLQDAGFVSSRADGVRSSYQFDLDMLKAFHQQLGSFIDTLEADYKSCCAAQSGNTVHAVEEGEGQS
ncbi:ArsR/SmtB family transcription factor [Coralliovum pocilloporae]|uniref:ArsR/SmtB family transcription factor n=1 Tax=Coralliovum pocilloporae TaxID=3066369 RepID=UPI0033071509